MDQGYAMCACTKMWLGDCMLQQFCWIFSNVSSLTNGRCYDWLKIHPKSALLLEPNLGYSVHFICSDCS